jgi:hypothetical protein
MEVLMMLPFEVTGRVLHEAERVDLWKTRNVSAFLMMLVKTVQHTPDRRDADRMHRPYPIQPRPHGVRNDGIAWGPEQANYAYFCPPDGGFMAVPWMPGGFQQAYPGYSQEYPISYDQAFMQGYQAATAASPAQNLVAAPASPQSGFATPAFAVVSGSWDPGNSPQSPPTGAIAVPVSPQGLVEYSPGMAPVVIVPASPQQCAQAGQVPDLFFELPPAPVHKYIGRDGTQTPELGSDPGEGLHESFILHPGASGLMREAFGRSGEIEAHIP